MLPIPLTHCNGYRTTAVPSSSAPGSHGPASGDPMPDEREEEPPTDDVMETTNEPPSDEGPLGKQTRSMRASQNGALAAARFNDATEIKLLQCSTQQQPEVSRQQRP